MAAASRALNAPEVASRLRGAGVDWAVSVPDWVQLPLYLHLQGDPAVQMVPVCAEDEAIGVAAGLTMAGRTPVVLLQNQGLYAAVNNIRAITLDAELPMVFVIGQFGMPAADVGQPAETSHRRVVRLLPRLLSALELASRPLDGPEDLHNIDWAFAERAEGRSAVLVMSRNMQWKGSDDV